MRLINTETLELHDFTTQEIPAYAILSHRWNDEEVSYKEFSKGRRQETKGYRKILEYCDFLRRWKRKWACVDTVCVDKRSSAELSEAINSIFKWYGDSQECHVLLHDVSCVNKAGSDVSPEDLQQFSESVWFERGWTLQELLAPMHVVFCSSEWPILGCKISKAPAFSLNPSTSFSQSAILTPEVITWAITQATGIPDKALLWPPHIRQFSVAQKLSWASRRRTTRVEDEAYCLLGLLGINMPLLYGEGDRAFLRLQQEIIRSSHDESIYARTTDPSHPQK